jgi:hypothetical protein
VITHYMGGQQLYWTLTGCTPGRRHYRLCTSKTLQQPEHLWCPFCKFSEQLWQEKHLRVPPACELAFMQLLTAHGRDSEFCCQVQPLFWPAPCDFYNWLHGFWVQIDGRCHWVGMHQQSSSVVLLRDLEQNWAALRGGGCVVRVHGVDVSKADCVLAAMAVAEGGSCIVLTPSYMHAYVRLGACLLPYVHAVMWGVPNCRRHTDACGNSIICIM